MTELFIQLLAVFVVGVVVYSFADYRYKQWKWSRKKNKLKKAVEKYRNRRKK